jgi:hypothetical protein
MFDEPTGTTEPPYASPSDEGRARRRGDLATADRKEHGRRWLRHIRQRARKFMNRLLARIGP